MYDFNLSLIWRHLLKWLILSFLLERTSPWDVLYDCSYPCLHANNHSENWQRWLGDLGLAFWQRLFRRADSKAHCSPSQVLLASCRSEWDGGGLREYSAFSYYMLQTLQRGQRPRVSPPGLPCSNHFTTQIWGQGGKTHGKKEKSPSNLAEI